MDVLTKPSDEALILHGADMTYERVHDRVRLEFTSYNGEDAKVWMTVHDAQELAEKIMELGALLDKLDEFGG